MPELGPRSRKHGRKGRTACTIACGGIWVVESRRLDAMLPLDDRPRYESGFGIAWPRLPALVVGALAAAAGVAWLLKFAYVYHWYLIILLPCAGGALLGGALFALVGWTR